MFRGLGFRGLGFRGLGFRGLGFTTIAIEYCCYTVLLSLLAL